MVLSRYVSLSSIVAAIAVAVTVWSDPGQESMVIQIALTIMAGLIIWRHRSNIKRLLNGTESRFGKKKEAQA
jgi:glycerol-3-phosphate acyltransferase PlsY